MDNPKLIEALTMYWGKRCPDHDDNCAKCQAWAEYDALVGERAAIVAWLRESAAWHDKHDDGLSGFDRISQGQSEAADAIEAGEHHART